MKNYATQRIVVFFVVRAVAGGKAEMLPAGGDLDKRSALDLVRDDSLATILGGVLGWRRIGRYLPQLQAIFAVFCDFVHYDRLSHVFKLRAVTRKYVI